MTEEHLTVKELPESERPYEKAMMYGVEALTDAELLAVIIRNGTQNLRSIEIAHRILNLREECPGLLCLCYLSREELESIPGIGWVKATELLALAEISKRISSTVRRERIAMNTPETIANYYMELLRHAKREKVIVVFFDGKARLIRDMVLSEGTVNSSLVSPREIFMEALRQEAVYIVLLHNHPSGDPTPSGEDIAITKKVMQAGEQIGITLLDHIVIGDCRYISFREQNLLENMF